MHWRRNNYILPAPELSIMLPDGFSIGDFRLVTRLRFGLSLFVQVIMKSAIQGVHDWGSIVDYSLTLEVTQCPDVRQA